MTKQKRGKGRPKGSLGKGEVSNYIFWKGMLKDNLVQQFIDRGNNDQKLNIKLVLEYLHNEDSELFDEVGGINLLKQLKDIKPEEKIIKEN